MTAGLAGCVLAACSVRGAEPVDFLRDIKPILESACLNCHGPEKPKGDLRLDTRAGALTGGRKGAALVPGKPEESPLYKTTTLPAASDDVMPPKGEPLAKSQIESLRQWIAQGANWPAEVILKPVRRVDFVKDIQPILEQNCVACHQAGHAKGGLRLDTRELAFKGGNSGPGIVPARANSSPVYTSAAVSPEDDKLMPPKA